MLQDYDDKHDDLMSIMSHDDEDDDDGYGGNDDPNEDYDDDDQDDSCTPCLIEFSWELLALDELGSL